jgi:hypothetical protein
MNTRIIITPDTATGDLLITMKSGSKETFADGIAALKENIAPDFRTFDGETKRWRIKPAGRAGFNSWLCFMSTHAKVEWNGKSQEKDAPRTPSRAELYATLYLLPDAPPIVVKSAYRALAQINHPDIGGDHATMQRINDAYSRLRLTSKERAA